MNFADRLHDSVHKKRTSLIVGLDPRPNQLPEAIAQGAIGPAGLATAYKQFCFGIIDVIADAVPAVKPQAAFFEQLGPEGMLALRDVIAYARQHELLVVLDAKRGDIGSTAAAYAEGYLGPTSAWGADALTVNPYLGDDSLTPFVDQCRDQNAGIFVLVKTSNPGGKAFQDLEVAGGKVYQRVADHVEMLASSTLGECGYGAVGAVVGATYPAELQALRKRMPHTWFLIPGFGSQGGTADDVAGGFDRTGAGAIINSSRAIIFAYQRPEYQSHAMRGWQYAVEQATKDAVLQLRKVG